MPGSRKTPHLAFTALLTLPLSCTASLDPDEGTATDAQGCRSIPVPQSKESASDSDDGPTTETDSDTSSTSTTEASSTTDPTTSSGTSSSGTDTSSTTGTEPVCGDGIVEGNEECDQGDENGDDQACTASCKVAVCGDGLVFAGVEDCDGDGLGNGGETATCNVDCTEAACGDGKLNKSAGEECDDANTDDDDGCSSTCEYEPLRVFLTSEEKYRGDLSNNMMQDPLEFADSECQKYADAAGLDGTFMAWLSDGTTGAFERMPFPEGFFEYDKGIVLAATGEQVASSWASLLVAQPTLDHAIDTDENGTQHDGNVYVWTHTMSDGSTAEGVPCPGANNISPWTSAILGDEALYGVSMKTNVEWTQATLATCSADLRLYCFELPPPPEQAP